VARHLTALDSVESVRWSLDDTDWLRLMHPGSSDARARWILFEQSQGDQLRISRLHRINGMITNFRTELLLILSPILVLQQVPRLTVTAPSAGREWSEELALDGAPDRPGAPWSWCERDVQIGAAVLNGR